MAQADHGVDTSSDIERVGREFVPADFARLSPSEALYIQRKFVAASEMKTAIKRVLDDLSLPDRYYERLKRVMEDWLNVPTPD